MNLYLKIAFQLKTIRISIGSSIVVGSLINLLYQDLERIHWFKIGCTYLIVYLFAVFLLIKVNVEFKLGNIAFKEAKLRCTTCGDFRLEVKKGEQIPFCPKCEHHTQWEEIS